MGGRAIGLVGRSAERGPLDRLIADARAGQSRALVIHGEPGVGKTALLEYAAGQASDFRVTRGAGVQAERELAFAGLHQLCAPMLDHLDRVPAPQRDALGTAFGISAGPAPDPFLIGLAVLSLLSDAAEDRPLLCLLDDQQWLDHASARILAFVARRLGAESVAMIFGARVLNDDLMGLPELAVGGLADADARTLLDSALTGPLDAQVRDRIIAESRGNPLALLELPQGLTAAEMAGGFGLPGTLMLSGGVEDSFRRRIEDLPVETGRLLLLAAVDPTGDASLLWRAAERLGVKAAATTAATEAGLAEFGTWVRFRHPLVRSVVYRSATLPERQEAHRALAEVTDRTTDPDRRAWHLAQAACGPDEDVAGELERSADRAGARGGFSAAAAFLEHAAKLTLDPPGRARRALAAATAKFQAGAYEAAQNLLAMAEPGPLSDFERARIDLLRARIAFATSRGGEAPYLLVKAAKRFEPIDPGLARGAYLDALSAALFAGRLASPGGGALEVARAAAAAPRPPRAPRAPDLLLTGMAALAADEYAAGVPALREALAVFGDGMSGDEQLRRLWQATSAALALWDDEHWDVLSARYVRLARTTGALSELPLALSTRAMLLVSIGELTSATSLVEEQRTVTEATGSNLAPYSGVSLAAMRGRQAETSALIETITREVPPRGEGIGIAVAQWANAVLHNGFGNYSAAVSAVEQARYHHEYPSTRYLGSPNWAAVEFVEAAVRLGRTEAAAEACRWITALTGASRTDWALGLEARSRALLATGETAERRYRDAIRYLSRTRVRPDLARAHLLFGEWLRRERRRTEARDHLRTARNMLDAIGMEAFAERARRELLATGEKARKRTVPTTGELTAQEAQIARLARDGLSNPEIATRLFISARTVQYHLRKVFTKLDITSRSQLDRALP